MNTLTVEYIADNLEKAGRVLCNMEVLLESDADRESLCDVLAYALHSVQCRIHAAVQVLRQQTAPGGDGSPPEQSVPNAGGSPPEQMTPTLDPEQMERNIQEAERVGQEVWEHFGRRQ